MSPPPERLLFEQRRPITRAAWLALPPGLISLAILTTLALAGRLPWYAPVGLLAFWGALLAWLLSVRIHIALTDAALYIRVRPRLMNRRVPIADIASAARCPMFGSVKVGWRGGATLVNHGATDGVKVTLRAGPTLLLGCDEPEALLALLPGER